MRATALPHPEMGAMKRADFTGNLKTCHDQECGAPSPSALRSIESSFGEKE